MGDGIHVATRRTSATNIKDIVSIVELGTNIGATANTYPYFMHCFTQGGAIDAGILFKNNVWLLYSYGTINETNNWKEQQCSGFSAGNTVQISTRVSGTANQLIVEAKKVGSSTNNVLTVNLTAARANSLRNSGSEAAREMNIASHLGNINNEAAFFSWSRFVESSVTNVSNVTVKVTTSNSSLDAVRFDIQGLSRPNLGYGRDNPTTVSGYVVDRAWCRCNNQ
ncbi:hypothetical protein FACS1894127_6810 [Clostridia bacterium]|nr:hypothetical protein FACS1894127_6810 [Clostridia bacterium]